MIDEANDFYILGLHISFFITFLVKGILQKRHFRVLGVGKVWPVNAIYERHSIIPI